MTGTWLLAFTSSYIGLVVVYQYWKLRGSIKTFDSEMVGGILFGIIVGVVWLGLLLMVQVQLGRLA
jgi:hypothetical protein